MLLLLTLPAFLLCNISAGITNKLFLLFNHSALNIRIKGARYEGCELDCSVLVYINSLITWQVYPLGFMCVWVYLCVCVCVCVSGGGRARY